MATVALTEKHRNEIYQHLAPTWGDEVTQAFLSQFPAREGEEPITRDFLRAELADLRTEMRTEMSDQRGELRADMAGLRGEVRAELADLRTEMTEQRGELRAELTGLRSDMNRMGSRLAGLVVGVSGVLTAVIALT
jgi:ribosomal protein L29